MPTIYGMELPRPTNWQEFERITRDAMALKWASPNLTLHGRQGQEQNGVDIYGADDLGRMTGIQCKRYAGPLRFSVVEDEVANAEKFDGFLATLYVATTADTDAPLQARVRALSVERSAKRLFGVGLLFWDDIVAGLVRNHQVFAAHFPQFRLPPLNSQTQAPGKLAAIHLGYYGRWLTEFLDLAFGDMAMLAQQDPYEFQGILRVIGSAAVVAPPAETKQLLEWLSLTDDILFGTGGSRDYAEAKFLAKRVEDRVKVLPSILSGADEADFVELGMSLGAIYHSEADFSRAASERVFRQVSVLFPDAIARLAETLSRLEGGASYWAGPRLMGFIEEELRWGSGRDAAAPPASQA